MAQQKIQLDAPVVTKYFIALQQILDNFGVINYLCISKKILEQFIEW